MNTTLCTQSPASPSSQPLPVEPSSERLMEAYQQGDARAFNLLVRRHTRLLLCRLARGASGTMHADLAHDVVQQTFLQVHRARDSYQLGAPFLPWLLTIANNALCTQRRRDARRWWWEQHSFVWQRMTSGDAHTSPAEIGVELSRTLAAFQNLPERERNALERSLRSSQTGAAPNDAAPEGRAVVLRQGIEGVNRVAQGRTVSVGAHKASLRRGRSRLREMTGREG